MMESYELVTKIGKGASGSVFLARSLKLKVCCLIHLILGWLGKKISKKNIFYPNFGYLP